MSDVGKVVLDVPTAFAEEALLKGLPLLEVKLSNSRKECTMAKKEHKNWRELCNAALDAKDPDELLKIIQQLKKSLKREEQVRRAFREAVRANKSSNEARY
jgi:hypothetical protein